MPDPFEMPDAAFEPFFNDTVGYFGKRRAGDINQALAAAVFEMDYGDATGLVAVDSSQRAVQFLIRESEWRFTSKPQIGDTITWDHGAFKVEIVQRSFGDWALTAREVA